MAKTKTVKRIVAHPKLYLRVDGKLQHVKKGTELTITAEQCKQLGAKLMDPAEQEKLDTTAEGGKLVESLATDLEAANAETKKAQDLLVKTATDLEAAKKKIAALEKAAKK